MELYKNFDGKAPMIDVNDAAMLLIDHQSGLSNVSAILISCAFVTEPLRWLKRRR